MRSETVTEQEMLSNVLILRATDFAQLKFVVTRLLRDILSGRDRRYANKFHRVKLIVIDSISFLVKYRERVVQCVLEIGRVLSALCADCGVAWCA